MNYVNENQINVENTAVTAIEQLRRFRDIILCRGEDGTCCCSCTGCKLKKPQKSKKPGYRKNRAIAGENTFAGGSKRGKNVRERYNGIITVKESEEPRRKRDGKNEESNGHSNEKRSEGRVSRKDKHEKKKTEENVEIVEEKRLLREVARMDNHEEEKARTSVLKSVEKEDEGYPADLDVDAVPEKKASADFRSKVNTISVSGVHDRKSRKVMSKIEIEDENEDKEGTSRRHRSEKEINSGKDEEQTIEDTKGQIMEIISREVGNENKERERGEPSKRNEPTNEFEDAKESLVGNEARLQTKNKAEVLSDQESPVVSKQEESGVADIHEEERRETRSKMKKKLNCTNVDQELKKHVKDEAYALVRNVISRVLTDKKLMSAWSQLKQNKSSESVEIPSVGKAEYERRKDGANDAELKGDQARKESLEAAKVPGHNPTFEIKSKEDLGKQNEEAADKPSESDVSSVDVIHLSNETLSMTAGLGPVPVKSVDSSPTIRRRKSVTFNTNITKIHLYAPDYEEYSSYQENPTWRKFPDGQDDFSMKSSSSMNESQPVENLPVDASHTETRSHLADSEPVHRPVDTATSKHDINYQTILEITQKFVSLLNENGLKRAQSVASKAVEPVNKDEGLHKSKLDMVFQEDKEDQKGYEYEEEEREEEKKVDYNTSPGHKGPSKYPGDENLSIRGSAVGQDDHLTIPSGHSDLILSKEVGDSEMTTGQPGSIQAASSVQYPSSPESREPSDDTVPVRNTTLPLDYDQYDQMGMNHESTSLEEAQQRETDEDQDGRELWRTNLPPPLPKPDLLAPNPFPRRGNSLPVVRGPPSQTSIQATTTSSHGRTKGKSNSLSKTPISDISHDLAKEIARIPTTMPSMRRPFDPIQGSKLGEAHDVFFQPPSLPKPPLKNNFKEILAPINGRSPSPVLHDVLLRGNVPHSYPIPKPPPLPRQAWSERNLIHGVEGGAWGIDSRTMTPDEEEPYIHYPHPPPTPAPNIHQPHPPSTPVTSTSSASHFRRRYKLRAPNVPGFYD